MEIYNIDLCECCIGIAYNGEWESHDDCTAHTPLSKLEWPYSVSTVDEDPEPHFGYHCDGCDTHLAGSRYECHYLAA